MNTFVLPLKWQFLSPFRELSPYCKHLVSTSRMIVSRAALQKVKHINVMLRARSNTIDFAMNRSDWTGSEFDHVFPAGRLDMAHERAIEWGCGDRNALSMAVSSHENLQSVDFDVTNDYCPLGCCRELSLYFDLAMQCVEKVRFFDLRNDEEKGTILKTCMQDMYLTPEKLCERFHIEFEADSS
ncbi:hypothetical protein BU25DRAFT_414750 [Macroventuria anomochaeta]|uniref:Uncharacterized protein n=1 Tax=Macroventuria anomochaeta TaxID=301207 RepID=A0ACB6RMF6_9PLEO|nr:uncharacterized protein BU25DRAFT_414750 [Macroventuria anomochaeta]KAF2622983.1 hypothetical protein BU25DRAFT_414750 [Macroventuria anomochaeta]